MRNLPHTLLLLIGVMFAPITSALAQSEDEAEFQLGLPIQCAVGLDCFVQNYVDTDSSRLAKDFTCGALTFNGSTETDFRLGDIKQMEEKILVQAAAPGVVKAARTGEQDGAFFSGNQEPGKERPCGNGVIIDHGNGWETQYCHLKKDSVWVSRTQTVDLGQRLGHVGMSGQTEFPHLSFRVRYKGKAVDPMTRGTPLDGCGLQTDSMWAANALPYMEYKGTVLLNEGFADTVPTMRGVEEGIYHETALTTNSDGVIYFLRIMGLQVGDVQNVTLVGPNGAEIAQERITHTGRNKAVFLRYVGQKKPDTGWQVGQYIGKFQLLRNGEVILNSQKVYYLGRAS